MARDRDAPGEPSANAGSMLRLALVQIDAVVGDLAGNAELIRQGLSRAREHGAAIVVFPELAVTGYPPEDLLLKPQFLADARTALQSLLPDTAGMVAIVGVPWVEDGRLYNGAAVLAAGRLAAVVPKHHLPTYGVFDEDRYFARGEQTVRFLWGELRLGVTVCEDIWYPVGPASSLGAAGVDLIVNINASPYHIDKWRRRDTMLATRANDTGAYLGYVNLVGGQDELVFDGNSAVLDPSGAVLARGASFDPDLLLVDLPLSGVLASWLHDPRRRWLAGEPGIARLPVRDHRLDLPWPAAPEAPIPAELTGAHEPLTGEAEVYAALVTGVRDYLAKTGFRSAVLSLSGGIDSSLTACVAVDALGAGAVTGITLPSRYSSAGSVEDSRVLAEALGIRFEQIPIEPIHAAYRAAMAPFGVPREIDVAEENVQARIRGNLMMTWSNRFGAILLTTGNKSELATGYATLYGDMAGGFAVLKDVPKLLVYRLARFRNSRSPVIPARVLEKPASAELKPNQTTAEALAPFPILDPILERYVERDESIDQIVAAGFDRATVERIARLVNRAEYKRRQIAPGPKLTPRAFGRDRRLPIANRYPD